MKHRVSPDLKSLQSVSSRPSLVGNPIEWQNRVLEQERRELEKLEQILAKERERAARRDSLAADIVKREETRLEAAKRKEQEREAELKERGRSLEAKSKAKEEASR